MYVILSQLSKTDPMLKASTSNKDKADTYHISVQVLCRLGTMTVCLTTSILCIKIDKLRQKVIH
jgi:hypothetical protein